MQCGVDDLEMYVGRGRGSGHLGDSRRNTDAFD